MNPLNPTPSATGTNPKILIDCELEEKFDINLSDVRLFARHRKDFALIDCQDFFAIGWMQGRMLIKFLLSNNLLVKFKRGAQSRYKGSDFLFKSYPEIVVRACSECRRVYDSPVFTPKACICGSKLPLSDKHPFSRTSEE